MGSCQKVLKLLVNHMHDRQPCQQNLSREARKSNSWVARDVILRLKTGTF